MAGPITVPQVIPFPRPWTKRFGDEGWDKFRPFVTAAAPPPPPPAVEPRWFSQVTPFPKDQTWEVLRSQEPGWANFRLLLNPPPANYMTATSLRFWPDDEAFRLQPWDYFRPYWTEPSPPPPPPATPTVAYYTAPSLLIEQKDEAVREDYWRLFRPYWQPPTNPALLLPPPPPAWLMDTTMPVQPDLWTLFRPYWVEPPAIPPPPPGGGGGTFPPFPPFPPFPAFPPWPDWPPFPPGSGGGGGGGGGMVIYEPGYRDEERRKGRKSKEELRAELERLLSGDEVLSLLKDNQEEIQNAQAINTLTNRVFTSDEEIQDGIDTVKKALNEYRRKIRRKNARKLFGLSDEEDK